MLVSIKLICNYQKHIGPTLKLFSQSSERGEKLLNQANV